MAFRRGNKSNKVPNVKLRPALPNPPRKLIPPPSNETLRHHDSGFDSEQENSFVDTRIPRPFRGVVLCATGISDKMSLFKRAIELGAQPLNDLTDRVTHLLAIEPGSAKYKCALENNITIMHPSWVEDSYNIWLKGDDVDLAESIKQHRLPIFDNVTICLSGVNDEGTRQEIIQRVVREGGSYVENIERPVKVSHLLCTSDLNHMSERMRYAVKFNQRREADIKIIWLEWIWDCLEAGGRYDEEAYDVSKPRPMRNPNSEATGPREESQDTTQGSESKEEEEAAIPVKLAPAATNEIWGRLLKSRGFEAKSGKLMRSPTKLRDPARFSNNLQDTPTKPRPKRDYIDRVEFDGASEQRRSTLKSLRRTTARVTASNHLINIGETTSSRSALNVESQSATTSQSGGNIAGPSHTPQCEVERLDGKSRFFAGLTFRLRGEAKSPHVKTTLEEAGGRVVGESSEDTADFIIVRLVSGSKLFREDSDMGSRSRYRTECWLERCISEGRVCSADEHISFTPLSIMYPITGASDLTVSISGLEEAESCWVRRLLRALGINFAPSFSRRSTHLLCPSRSGAKHGKAREWNIPVVGMDWLVHVIQTARVPASYEALEPQPDARLLGTDKQGGSSNLAEIGVVGDSSVDSFGEPVGLLSEPEASEAMASTGVPADDASRLLSLAELREDMLNTHIPSSETPSPIKRPSASPSSAKISREATRVLQESITTLLGKRMSSEDATNGRVPRPKRVRPPSRTKTPRDDVLPVPNPISPPQEPYHPFSLEEEDVTMLAAVRSQEDDGVRVTYEDPAQNSEKLRLMKLLQTQKPPDVWELDLPNSEPVAQKGTPTTRRRQPRRSARSGGS